jgi:hypothetical protein
LEKIEKIMKVLKKLDKESFLSPQKILFHRATNDHSIVGLLMAGKYAITLLMCKVINKPINKRVIDAFLKSQISQLCETYIYLHNNTSTWAEVETCADYIINSEEN